MPLAKVIEATEVGSGALKKLVKLGCMVLRAADKMSGRARGIIDREIDDTEMFGADLLSHEDTADLPYAGVSQMRTKTCALAIR
jgi:hypothetical protein